MKKEELVRRLVQVEIPVLLVKTHREQLKRALLEAPHYGPARGKRPPVDSIGRVFGNFWDWLRAPAWRAAAASAVAIFMVAAVLAVTFYMVSPSPAVVAADVVKKDPHVQQTLSGSGEIIIVKVQIRDGIANVVCGRGMGDFVEADVDIIGRAVISTRRFEGIFLPELPLQAQDDAVKIAKSDPKVKAIVDRGGTIGKVFPIFSSISSVTIVNSSLVKVTPISSQAVVPIYHDGKTLLVQVNLDEKRTERIIEPQFLVYFDLNRAKKL